MILLGAYSLAMIVWDLAGIINDQMHPENIKYGVGTMIGEIMLSVAIPLLICTILILRRVRWVRIASVIVLVVLAVWIPIALVSIKQVSSSRWSSWPYPSSR